MCIKWTVGTFFLLPPSFSPFLPQSPQLNCGCGFVAKSVECLYSQHAHRSSVPCLKSISLVPTCLDKQYPWPHESVRRAHKPLLESAAVIPAAQRNENWRRHYICPAHRETLHSHRARPQSATPSSTPHTHKHKPPPGWDQTAQLLEVLT